MYKFIDKDLEKKTRDSLEYLESKDVELGRFCGFELIYEPGFLIKEYYEGDSDDQIMVDNYSVSVRLDDSDTSFEITLIDFIDLIEETKEAKIINNLKFISNKRCLIRSKVTEVNDFEEYMRISNLLEHPINAFKIESEIDGIKFSCSFKKGITIFGILSYIDYGARDFFPYYLSDDSFVEITFCDSKSLTDNQIEKIYQAYCFELGASHGIYLTPSPRPQEDQYVFNPAEFDDSDYILRPLMFGPGMMEVQKLFNQANEINDNPDYSIIQYTKIIENVSQTVIRESITQLAYKKLMSSKALWPDADYIKELEKLFIDNNQKFEKDKEAINVTVKKCCDILEISDYAPEFLSKIKKLKENLDKPNINKVNLIEVVFETLTDTISATRNSIVHAKANYNLTGKECPEQSKADFSEMLKIVCIQVIRWFATVGNSLRIT